MARNMEAFVQSVYFSCPALFHILPYKRNDETYRTVSLHHHPRKQARRMYQNLK